MSFIYRQMKKLFVNIFSRQATKTVLQCVRIKYGGDSQWNEY